MIRITPYGDVTRFDLSRTIAGRGRYWTTAYLVDELMVDTGCAHTAAELVAGLESSPVTRIINTHSHEDHFGANNALVKQNAGLNIYAHPGAVRVMSNPRRYQSLHPYRRLMWGWPDACDALPVEHGHLIETESYHFKVIYTPGHSPDHLCLYEPEQGWLFTGDLFVGGKDRALRGGYDILQMINSLKLLVALPAERMFPSSARVRDNPKSELQRKIDYYEEMGEKVLELNEQGKSVSEISRSLFGDPMLIEVFTLGHFSRRRLVLSYLGRNHEKQL
jgi:glyoxylase-like metal-dependent hydrolase (beta-lactamase superfamily II)